MSTDRDDQENIPSLQELLNTYKQPSLEIHNSTFLAHLRTTVMDEALPNTASYFSRLSLTPIQDTIADSTTQTITTHDDSAKFFDLPGFGNEVE
jgi:hypothetical protein